MKKIVLLAVFYFVTWSTDQKAGPWLQEDEYQKMLIRKVPSDLLIFDTEEKAQKFIKGCREKKIWPVENPRIFRVESVSEEKKP